MTALQKAMLYFALAGGLTALALIVYAATLLGDYLGKFVS